MGKRTRLIAAAVIKVIDGYDRAGTGTFIHHTGEGAAW